MTVRVAIVKVRNDSLDFFGVVLVGVLGATVCPECPVDGRRAVGPPESRIDPSGGKAIEGAE
ncbi:hypothetical protein C435_16585 [Haloarcula marismortui ATCC 33799]|jgi:hypothetical protein|uniref:Uncharacterized protein n=1 Tax=Haloarcula marismortui ATCC 33799 TaxID=662475 RepID=M0K033_9EURY|nr:hypothetical protein C435_16585 [Haloarcula californiae ATCC 33799]